MSKWIGSVVVNEESGEKSGEESVTRYFIGIGSNYNAQENCQQMIAALKERFGDIKLSRIIQTKACGIEAPDYMNAVACIDTEMDFYELNHWCKNQEQDLGRDRQQILCSADLDVLLAVDEEKQINLEKIEEKYFRLLVAEL